MPAVTATPPMPSCNPELLAALNERFQPRFQALAQAVFQKPLKQSTRVVYHITGPWLKPVVKVIEKGPRREPVKETASSGPAAGEP